MTEIREKIASAVATAQNVPFVGPKQLRIADAILPLIREAQAEAVSEFAAELDGRYTARVFKPLSDADHKSVNDAMAGRAERTHVTRDAVSADMMRRAAAQARDYASDIREAYRIGEGQ